MASDVEQKKIGTHSGVFNCDEVLACSLLSLLPQYSNYRLVRTRDLAELNKCDIVVDVGEVFDHEKKRYDHHQREFNETLSSLKPELGDTFKIKLNSAGLIYTYYGEEIIKQLIPKNISLNSADLVLIYKKIYRNFIEEIDALDNGIPICSEEPRYHIQTNLSKRVSSMNPKWNDNKDINVDDLFKKAMIFVTGEFSNTVNFYISVWIPARNHVRSALDQRFEVHNCGQIIEIRNPDMKYFIDKIPWKGHLFDLEKELNISGVIKYVLLNDYPNSWLVLAVPVTPGSFVTRKPLLRSWWGVKEEELSKVSGIEGCTFCHSTGFAGGNTTRAGALKMALVSLEADEHYINDMYNIKIDVV